jgi:lysozyme
MSTRIKGIDVSHHQNDIDWRAVKAAGVEFVFIKATEGTTFIDPKFKLNWKLAKEAGLIRGAYHFFRTTSPLEGNIANLLKTVEKLEPGDLPVVLDLEVPNQWADIEPVRRADLIRRWTGGISDHFGGTIKPILYMSPNFANETLGNAAFLSDYPLWLAHYTRAEQPRVPPPWSDWTFWQHTNEGKVPGIKGYVDLNLFNGTRKQLLNIAVA